MSIIDMVTGKVILY